MENKLVVAVSIFLGLCQGRLLVFFTLASAFVFASLVSIGLKDLPN